MKNKRWAIMSIVILLLALQTVLLTACSRTDAPDIESGAESEAGAAELVEIDVPVTEETDAGTGETVPEDNRPDGEYEMEESLLTQSEAETLIDPLVQWAGLYMIGRMDQRETFDDVLKSQMAAITLAYGYLPEISSEIVMAEDVDSIQYTAPEGYLYVSPDQLRAAEELLFGETIDNNTVMYAPDETGNICLNDGEGGMLVLVGDWGMEGPRGEIVSIENMGGILNMITVSYVLYDYGEDAVTEELGWIHYLVQGTAESGQTPKIIDMNIQVLFVDQEAYLYENWKDDAVEWEADAYTLELPGDWEERAYIYQENGACHFSCSAAASENYMGVLFTIVRIQRGVAMEAPDYEMLGEDAAGVYFAIFPSDVQFDPDDGYAAREYMDMYCYVEEILSTFQVR
ncbi:MAG: hypothetical protein K2K17_08160 [Lachnospiraceae bacterium]|nr:hypothetical protein [Lachnospiraceae bacterium]